MASRQLRSASSTAVACNKEGSPWNYIGHHWFDIDLIHNQFDHRSKLEYSIVAITTRFFLESR